MCKSNCSNNCTSCPMQAKSSTLSKIVADLVSTVLMLHQEHSEELSNVLLHEESLYDNLDKIEHLLWVTRQQRK